MGISSSFSYLCIYVCTHLIESSGVKLGDFFKVSNLTLVNHDTFPNRSDFEKQTYYTPMNSV